MQNILKDIDTVILCGGMGKRLRKVVSGRPKPMALVNGRPFLDVALDYAASFGLKRFILSVGYMAGFIKKYYAQDKRGLRILFAEEKEPLGTGGGVKNAQALVKSSPFLVLNGDSLCRVDFNDFFKFYRKKKPLASIVLSKARKQIDCGVVRMSGDKKITGFNEKAAAASKDFVSAGVYLFNKRVFSMMPRGSNFSLEKDFFPAMVGKPFYGYEIKSGFLDIGTPRRYKYAQTALEHYGL